MLDRAMTRHIVTLAGELDFTEAPAAADMLQEAVAIHPHVIVDVRALTFLDCAGARAIERARLEALERRGLLVISGPGGIPKRLLGLLGIPFTEEANDQAT